MVKLEDDNVFREKWDQLNSQDTFGKSISGFESGLPPTPAAVLSAFMNQYGMGEMKPVFQPGSAAALQRFKARPGSDPQRTRQLTEELERTFSISYLSGEDPEILSARVSRLPGVIYAEPHFVYHVTDERIPNDSLIGRPGQDHFSYHNFYRAWNVSAGSPDVVIAIIDTGVYFDHPDLKPTLWRNPEPGRANEFFSWEIVDDTIGWNFWESGDVFAGEPPVQNGNPTGNFSTHGTHVAGIAAAAADNDIGIAGTGFSSRYMAIKAGGTRLYPGSIAYGFHGVLYAAVNDADIINCSFGGPGFSHFGRDVIAFTTSRGSLVVAAAGNTRDNTIFYPAAYEDVLSVGSVTRFHDDVISPFSTYGYFVDVFARGDRLLSTVFDYDADEVSWTPAYRLNTGTSMAAPVVSGLAALVKARYPDWSPQRIAAQIRTNAHPIDHINPDPVYLNRLGRGRIDAYRTLTQLNPGIKITDYRFKNPDGEKINLGESGTLTIQGANHGTEVSGPVFSLQAVQPGIRIDQPLQQPGVIGADEPFELNWELTLTNDYLLSDIPEFRLDFQDPSTEYSDFGMIVYERLLYEIVDDNLVATSFASDGTIGYMDAFRSSGGIGFLPGDYGNVLYEAGLMVSGFVRDELDEPQRVVMNQVRDTTSISRDFLPLDNFRLQRPGKRSAADGNVSFRSANHPVFETLDIEMNTYSFTDPELAKTVFVLYSVANSGMIPIHDMHLGLFVDWDIRNYQTDHTAYIHEDSLLYTYDPDGPPYLAVAHLGAVSSAFAIDNASEMTLEKAQNRQDSLKFGTYFHLTNESFDGFTQEEKRLSLTAGTERTTVNNADIAVVSGTGPYTLMPRARIKTGFVLAWGEDPEDLRSQVAAARSRTDFEIHAPGLYFGFREIAERTTLFQNFPNPFNQSTTLEFHLAEPGRAELTVYNILGQKITTLFSGEVNQQGMFVSFDASGLSSGIYLAVLRTEDRTQTIKMSLVK